ncbi:helix-turn-helix transcriptional regulator [Paraburkholderia strydomiana]|uniref:helix-turn-helix transcriptional regulator n=1 Tax=Paraburkholderia strydomiana TaxID=1245417 RepID=UPI0038B7C0AC
MFSTFYFPLVSVLASSAAPAGLYDMIAGGRILAASTQISRHVESCDEDILPAWLQLQGDLNMTFGMELDADESFRQAQKKMRASRLQMRAASCRNAGWQALFRHRLGTAMACFTRVVEDTGGDAALRLEGLFGTFCVLFDLGRLREAGLALDELENLLTSDAAQFHNVAGWHDLIDTVRFDLTTQSELRSHAELADHGYWQPGFAGDAQCSVVSVPAALMRRAAAGVKAPLLRGRIEFLEQLHALAEGGRDAERTLNEHLNWAAAQGLTSYQRAARLEMMLASLAGGVPQLAESIINLLSAESRGWQGHRQLEYLYGLAKLRHLQGRNGESLTLYARYAVNALRCVRDEAGALAQYTQRTARPPEQLDDIAARLPAKYRRAYRFLVANLERKDLSIREIALEIGVTDRALQSTFKNSLGSTPSEIIRQLRMQRIRAELQAASGSERGILEAASKWGVSNRSTLVNGYRRQFNEAPSDTLNR